MKKNFRDFLILRSVTIKEAMRRLSHIGERQLFVIDRHRKLCGALSDGDIRKHILKGGPLSALAGDVCNNDPRFVSRNYVFEELKNEMLAKKIEAMPVVGISGKVEAVLTWEDVFSDNVARYKDPVNIQVVIMAGGKGTRLEPFTKVLPKPLIPVDDKPVIEHIMDDFHAFSVQEFFVALNYKAGVVKAYFSDLVKPYRIHFVHEDKPMGTAGALTLMSKSLRDPFVVINCDMLMDINLADLVDFHKNEGNDLTLVTCCRHYVIPYGVCEIDSKGKLLTIVEKPEQELLVNTGLYVMSKKILSLMPVKSRVDMTELCDMARRKKCRIGVYPVAERAWRDIGQWNEYWMVGGGRDVRPDGKSL